MNGNNGLSRIKDCKNFVSLLHLGGLAVIAKEFFAIVRRCAYRFNAAAVDMP